MCDYSLQSVKSRPAAVGDKLVVKNFGTGTRGFCAASEWDATHPTAVCVLPGTELAFDAPIHITAADKPTKHRTAIFRQVDKNEPYCHHDRIEFPDGHGVMLTFLQDGQLATVLQLPAAPKNAEEVEAQRRVDVAG
jgi:hypothetical protein